MSGTTPGADELRMRHILRQRGVGPDAEPPPAARPQPSGRPRDWLDDILDSPPPAAPEPETEPAKPKLEKPKPKSAKKKRRKKKPRADHPAWDSHPRQSLLDAYDRIPYRIRWLAYHASAAYLGWSAGLVDYATYVTAWIADAGLVGVQATFWYCAGAATFVLYRRTRRWWMPVAWMAAIPACSTVVGVLLYAPTQ
jgi:hypothetical protein